MSFWKLPAIQSSFHLQPLLENKEPSFPASYCVSRQQQSSAGHNIKTPLPELWQLTDGWNLNVKCVRVTRGGCNNNTRPENAAAGGKLSLRVLTGLTLKPGVLQGEMCQREFFYSGSGVGEGMFWQTLFHWRSLSFCLQSREENRKFLPFLREILSNKTGFHAERWCSCSQCGWRGGDGASAFLSLKNTCFSPDHRQVPLCRPTCLNLVKHMETYVRLIVSTLDFYDPLCLPVL